MILESNKLKTSMNDKDVELEQLRGMVETLKEKEEKTGREKEDQIRR